MSQFLNNHLIFEISNTGFARVRFSMCIVHTCKVNVVLQSCKGTAFNSSLLLCFQYLLNSCRLGS
jgi:hypothetical protein